MGNRKRNPSQKPSTATIPAVNGHDQISTLAEVVRPDPKQSVPDSSPTPPGSADDVVKAECERALVSLRRGNHNKALRLMKDACTKHRDSNALLHRVQGTILVKVATLIDDQNAKVRYLRSAIESARKAVAISPDSVEFAHFYANLLYEAANDRKDYEEVVQECERALAIENPIDPAKESLQEESQQKLVTAEARISHFQHELRGLIQKSNITSISTWVKNLGSGSGCDKFRLIPMRRMTEDPMEIHLVQAVRRPNEIKKVMKTPEERRKEIEVRVTAARLLQQKSSGLIQLSQSEEDQANVESPLVSSSLHRPGERRKLMNARKLVSSTDCMDRVRTYMNSMSPESKKSLLEVNVHDLRVHQETSKDSLTTDMLSEAVTFAEVNHTWNFWLCCRCNEKFVDAKSHLQHIENEHVGILSTKLQSVLPQEIDGEWVDKIVNGSWKPIDAFSAIKILEEELICESHSDFDTCGGSKDRDFMSDDWSCRDDSCASSHQDESRTDCFSNGFSEKRDIDLCGLDPMLNNNSCKWPLSENSERLKLLEKIHGVFQLLVNNKCLSAIHLNKVIQFTMDELQGIPSGSQLMKAGLDQSPLCICFLGASQLRKILKFLQELSHSCDLGRFSENNGMLDNAHNVSHGCECLEKIVLSYDSSRLLLDSHFFRCKNITGDAESGHGDDIDKLDINALVSWLFSGTATEQLICWNRLREEKTQKGLEVLQMLEKDFYLLQNLCERKCEHLSYQEALNAVENLCLEELKRREQAAILIPQSYDAILRKRQEELVKRESDAAFIDSRFELDAISNVLKEAQSMNSSQFGYDDTLSGVRSRLCELDYGYDDDRKMHDPLHQAGTCIEVAIQRQKENISVKICKIDARIMRNLTGIEQLEHKLGSSLVFDYRGVVLPLMKSFMRLHLENLVDKDAAEKSDAAREAFLSELARDAKKSTGKDKMKDKKKNKDHRKSKDKKVSMSFGCNEALFQQEAAEEFESLFKTKATLESKPLHSGDYLKQQEEEEDIRRKMELEAEERKLEETLEYQRRIEDEAKQKHLEEQIKRSSGLLPQNISRGSSHLHSDCAQDSKEDLKVYNQTSLLENGGVSIKGINFDDFQCLEITTSQTPQSMKSDQGISKRGKELVLNKDVEQVSFNHKEKPHKATHGPTVLKSGQNDEISTHLDGSSVPETTSTISNAQRTKKSNYSHPKNKQGSAESFQNGNLHHDSRSDRHSKWLIGTSRSSNGSLGVLIGEENIINENPRTDIYNRGQAQKMSVDNLHGKMTSIKNLKDVGDTKRHDLDIKSLDASTEWNVPDEIEAKASKELHSEDDDEKRFQEDLKKAVRQSLDTYKTQKKIPVSEVSRSITKVSPVDDTIVSDVKETSSGLNKKVVLGTGLQNEAGEYNCFLNVIIQSLWHLRRFRNEFLSFSLSHVHIGSLCVICALHDIFSSLNDACAAEVREPVAPTCLRSALSNLYPDSNFFQEAQMNDASEVLGVIFDCLHRSSASSSRDCNTGSKGNNCLGSWDCSNTTCVAHSLFGMDIFEQMNCQSCGLESRHFKYTTFFHNINANSLRTTKITSADGSFDELLKLVEMNHQVACDCEAGGCGKPNSIHRILSSPPQVFTTVLGWQNTCESAEDITATLTAITTELDISVLYRGLDTGNKHKLISMVCYYGQHYHCFAYSHEIKQWLLYDDKTVKVVGSWVDLLSMCERGHLQPQVLFYEAVY